MLERFFGKKQEAEAEEGMEQESSIGDTLDEIEGLLAPEAQDARLAKAFEQIAKAEQITTTLKNLKELAKILNKKANISYWRKRTDLMPGAFESLRNDFFKGRVADARETIAKLRELVREMKEMIYRARRNEDVNSDVDAWLDKARNTDEGDLTRRSIKLD